MAIARDIGQQLKRLRLAKGWTQEAPAEKSAVAISTLKLLEAKGNGSFQRLIRVAVALGVRRVDDAIDQVRAAVADRQPIARDHDLSKSIIARVGLEHGLA